MFVYYFATLFLIYTVISKNVDAASDAKNELLKLLHDTCVAETGVNEDLIDKVNKEKVFANDEKLKCYVNCLMVQTACISDDGIVDVEAVLQLMPDDEKERLGPIIRKCDTQIGANPCDNAWLTNICYLKENEKYLLI